MTALLSITLSSCLKNQEDIFSEDPSTRLDKRLLECQEVLCSAEYGWAMDYYPDRNIAYGGWVYAMSFTPEKVTVTAELAPGQSETTYYKMTDDNGPILSFDTYNTLMHYFATPSSLHYEARDGDFEFLIMDIKPDLITLRGNRTGNTIYLHRLNRDIIDYVEECLATNKTFFLTELDGNMGETPFEATADLVKRRMFFTWDNNGAAESTDSYYLPTPTGLRFLNPIVINGQSVTEISYNSSTVVYSGQTDKGGEFKMTAKKEVLDRYAFYEEYAGEYTLIAHYGQQEQKLNVTVECNDDLRTYTVRGIVKDVPLTATYHNRRGCMELNCQKLGELEDGSEIWLDAWDKASGGFDKASEAGIYITKDPDNPGIYLVTPNDYAPIATDSFLLCVYKDNVLTGNAQRPWAFANNLARLTNITSFIKKQ